MANTLLGQLEYTHKPAPGMLTLASGTLLWNTHSVTYHAHDADPAVLDPTRIRIQVSRSSRPGSQPSTTPGRPSQLFVLHVALRGHSPTLPPLKLDALVREAAFLDHVPDMDHRGEQVALSDVLALLQALRFHGAHLSHGTPQRSGRLRPDARDALRIPRGVGLGKDVFAQARTRKVFGNHVGVPARQASTIAFVGVPIAVGLRVFASALPTAMMDTDLERLLNAFVVGFILITAFGVLRVVFFMRRATRLYPHGATTLGIIEAVEPYPALEDPISALPSLDRAVAAWFDADPAPLSHVETHVWRWMSYTFWIDDQRVVQRTYVPLPVLPAIGQPIYVIYDPTHPSRAMPFIDPEGWRAVVALRNQQYATRPTTSVKA